MPAGNGVFVVGGEGHLSPGHQYARRKAALQGELEERERE